MLMGASRYYGGLLKSLASFGLSLFWTRIRWIKRIGAGLKDLCSFRIRLFPRYPLNPRSSNDRSDITQPRELRLISPALFGLCLFWTRIRWTKRIGADLKDLCSFRIRLFPHYPLNPRSSNDKSHISQLFRQPLFDCSDPPDVITGRTEVRRTLPCVHYLLFTVCHASSTTPSAKRVHPS